MNETSVVGERDVCLKVWTAWRVDGSRIASRRWRGYEAGVGTWFWRAQSGSRGCAGERDEKDQITGVD